MDEAEQAIRLTVDAAERMAGVQVESVIVNITGGRLASQHYHARVQVEGESVSERDVHRVLEAAAAQTALQGRAVLHSLPTGFSLDSTAGVRDPKGMIGEQLGADMHVVGCDAAAVRNLMLAIERCHLDVEAMVATPYASGLAGLVDDETDMGTTLIDLGGGTTSIGVFSGGHVVHVDAIAVGGNHVTMDVARGLTIRLADAERLKTLYGSCIASTSDERETVMISQVGEDGDHPHHVPKSHLVRIIRPRVEEILELVRDRLVAAGLAPGARQRVVLTGGSCLLTGLPEAARRILSSQVRIGRPLGIQGLPESAKSPAFSASLGLLIYPQVAGIEHFEPRRSHVMKSAMGDGYISRVGRWLRESF
jgi:cell division protein FtsA